MLKGVLGHQVELIQVIRFLLKEIMPHFSDRVIGEVEYAAEELHSLDSTSDQFNPGEDFSLVQVLDSSFSATRPVGKKVRGGEDRLDLRR